MQALALKSDHTPSIFNLGCNFLKIKDYPEAKKWFSKAISVTVKTPMPDAYYGLCLTCINLGETQEAVDAIEKAIEVSGSEVSNQLKYSRALAYKVNGDLDKALDAYRVIMKDDESIGDFFKMI